jgi:radical SAM protein with 4Fe4S-binding SPASM domain
MMAVTCEGDVVPCLQMGGYVVEHGYKPDSLKERRLKEILTDGRWLSDVCANHYKLREMNRECGECPWFGFCAGGCRALAILGAAEARGEMDYFASDPLACLFFKGGWYDKIRERLGDFTLDHLARTEEG